MRSEPVGAWRAWPPRACPRRVQSVRVIHGHEVYVTVSFLPLGAREPILLVENAVRSECNAYRAPGVGLLTMTLLNTAMFAGLRVRARLQRWPSLEDEAMVVSSQLSEIARSAFLPSTGSLGVVPTVLTLDDLVMADTIAKRGVDLFLHNRLTDADIIFRCVAAM